MRGEGTTHADGGGPAAAFTDQDPEGRWQPRGPSRGRGSGRGLGGEEPAALQQRAERITRFRLAQAADTADLWDGQPRRDTRGLARPQGSENGDLAER